MDEERKVVTVDEAELTLLMLCYLRGLPPVLPGHGQAREILDEAVTQAAATKDKRLNVAIEIATALTHLAMSWLAEVTNSQHPGMIKKVPHAMPEARQ